MKAFLLFLISISAYGQQVLKAGVYRGLKPTEVIIFVNTIQDMISGLVQTQIFSHYEFLTHYPG